MNTYVDRQTFMKAVADAARTIPIVTINRAVMQYVDHKGRLIGAAVYYRGGKTYFVTSQPGGQQ